jgi:(2Fe-2S) ferredoxin
MGKDLTKVTHTLFMCNGGSCKKKGSEETTRELRCAIRMAGLQEQIHTAKTFCLGQCENAPVAFVAPDNCWYKNITDQSIHKLIGSHFKERIPISDQILYKEGDARMHPARILPPKTRGRFTAHQDRFLGEIYGISIYPWEFNIYPLLKELFEVFSENLQIWIAHEEVKEQKFRIRHEEEKSLIMGKGSKVLKEVVMKAGVNKEYLQSKVDAIKLYHRQADNSKGLYMANPREGMFLNAVWNQKGAFWHHITRNYALISG